MRFDPTAAAARLARLLSLARPALCRAIALLTRLEHPPIRLDQPDREAAAQALDSGAMSYRPDESVRWISALADLLDRIAGDGPAAPRA